MNSARKKLKEILGRESLTICPLVYDSLSAHSAGSAGFEIGLIAGSVESMMVLGAPDIALVTLTELAQIAAQACGASAIPLLVDADHGYGNALNGACTVKELENAGVAGLTIEDYVLPRPFGVSKATLTFIEEWMGKLLSALDARSDPGLAIIARTNVTASSMRPNALRGYPSRDS
ncbi:carboxyvinyl-carboxyphosphonate phosphorylmutase [Caballeronia udeis]|uniref:Carboxyvinyl-carboxyphosphonate phosphorylmutase n=1 Tax=Caballeronia udeis TaxID=1232866 RepID=A0A158JJP6_9BURK|nr:isocitrate lyase/phosphoenolpyruvate mutase family protein [Caballeronia udeis]SAL68689.1 carboxyvinyl-carboxyphosphonate phosphorylmutase [Caballeronia udeis]